MEVDKEFEAAAAQGRRNRETRSLIQNWCAHARLERLGGVGMIEQMTGDPIGHFALACDHAGRAGLSSWDLAHSALDFYDRYCVGCTERKGVGLPNLSKLVAERDQRRIEVQAAQQKAEAKAHELLEQRRQRRNSLREKLPAVSAAIVEDIDQFDADRSRENSERLTKSAVLAPEHFPTALIEYIFELGEGEEELRPTMLAMLANVANDRARLAALALNSVDATYEIAADILAKVVDVIDPAMIGRALPAIVDRANPDPSASFHSAPGNLEPALLLTLWRAFPSEVTKGLEEQLSCRKRHGVELAARGFKVLQGVKPDAANKSARALVGIYVRAHLLVDDLDRQYPRLVRLSEVIATIFGSDPDGTDGLLQSFLLDAGEAVKARVYQVYSEVVRLGNARREGRPPSAAELIAFRRMLWAPTTETGDDVVHAAQEVFRHHARGLDVLAKADVDGLLGASLLLDDQLTRLTQDAETKKDDMLKGMQRMNRQNALAGLISSYLELASRVAAGDARLTAQVIAMVDALPETRERLKGEALTALAAIAASLDGLKSFLPHLYYGLVGSSVYVRSCAATALGELPRENRKNVPPLVYEAFTVLLSDRYVAVHKAAVRALDHFSLPEIHREEAAYAVLGILNAYRGKGDSSFLVTCIERLTRWMDVFKGRTESLKVILIDTAMEIEPLYLRSRVVSLARALGTHNRFPLLVARMLPEFGDRFNRDDDCRRLLWAIPDKHVRLHADRLVEVARGMIHDAPWISYEVLDRLGQSGADVQARRLADACVDDIEDTVRNRHLRLSGRFASIAHAFEGAVARGDSDELAAQSKAWQSNAETLDQHRADARERNSRSGLPFED